MRIFGVILLIAGFCSLAVGISFMSGADSTPTEVHEQTDEEFELVEGRYGLNGNADKGCIELFEGDTMSINGGEKQSFTLKVWKDMTVTDAAGKISVIDQYFLSTADYTCEYISADNTIVYNDRYYVLVK